jgi:hypothetical protein
MQLPRAKKPKVTPISLSDGRGETEKGPGPREGRARLADWTYRYETHTRLSPQRTSGYAPASAAHCGNEQDLPLSGQSDEYPPRDARLWERCPIGARIRSTTSLQSTTLKRGARKSMGRRCWQ